MEASELRVLLEQCHQESFAWAMSCCHRDRAQAEELLQTVYLKILEGKARFEGASAFKTWLFAVIRRTAAEERRKGVFRRLWFTPLAENDVESNDHSADEILSRSELQGSFLRAVDSLPRRQREVIHLVFYQDLTLADTAQVMGISLGSVRTHYERGKKRIRQLMEDSHVIDESGFQRKKNPGILPSAEAGR